MFDIGFWELLIIAIVLLLVMGPERLPEVARQAAFLVRKARQGMYRLRNEMQGEMDGTPFADLQAARREMSDFKNDIRQFGHELADSAQERKTKADGLKVAQQTDAVAPAPTATRKTSSKKAQSKKAPTNRTKTTKTKTTKTVRASKKKAAKKTKASKKATSKPAKPNTNKVS